VTAANALMRPIHERMPVILAAKDWAAWLDPENQNPAALQGCLRPYSADAMTAWPVSTLVNSPRHDEAGCVVELGNRPA
jgi:putative SOS response-associated peptidase YedK